MTILLVVCIILISLPSCVGFYTFPRLLLRRDVRFSTPPLRNLEFSIPSCIPAILPSKEYAEKVDVNPVVVNLLTLYKQFKGDLWISPLFTITRKKYFSWPAWSHGIKLGRMASTIRKLYKEDALSKDSIDTLELIGFHWSRYEEKMILEAVLTYQVLYGDMLVPCNYVIPDNDTCWSQSLGRMNLGCVVTSIRNGAMHLNMKPCLVHLGFDYTQRNETFERVGLDCLHNPAKELKLHDVFNNDNCPQHIRWIKVYLSEGNTLQEAMAKTVDELYDTMPEQRIINCSYVEVKDMDFDMKENTFLQVKEALLTYKTLYGHFKVPQSYIIAKDDIRYSERVRGMKLGRVAQSIREGYYGRWKKSSYRKELEAMVLFDQHICVSTIRVSTFAEVKEALLTYKTLYGDLKVPVAYIIAEDDARYPERVRGMKLGRVVYSIHNQGTYGSHRKELEAMGPMATLQK